MIEQDLNYHAFADPLGGLVSNVAFLLAGLGGLGNWRQQTSYQRAAFLGTILTAFGSAWYHANPDNTSLVWDRLPMTLIFAGVLAQALASFCSEQWARMAFAPLIVAGLASVFYWSATGDLTPYVVMQFGPMVAIPVMLWWRGGRGARPWWSLLGLYALAKLFEGADGLIYGLTAGWIGGHTIKHVIAAAAIWSWRKLPYLHQEP